MVKVGSSSLSGIIRMVFSS